MRIILAIGLFGLAGSCAGVKPYEKEYLLHPLMDEASLQSLTSSDFHGISVAKYEKLSATGSGGGATSCPTCGG